MSNTMGVEGYRAVIRFDPDIDLFRGEFVGLNGGADFHARDVAGLTREGATSLRVFSTCAGKTASSRVGPQIAPAGWGSMNPEGAA